MAYISTFEDGRDFLLGKAPQPQFGGHMVSSQATSWPRQQTELGAQPVMFGRGEESQWPVYPQRQEQGPEPVAPAVQLSGPGAAPMQGTTTTPAEQAPQQGVAAPAPFEAPDLGQSLGFGTDSRNMMASLFNPLRAGLEQGYGGLQTASQDFFSQAGPDRSFESINAPYTLTQYITQGKMGPKAHAVVGSSYRGPEGLDYTAEPELRARAEALASGRGLVPLVQMTGLPPGMAKWEAQNVWEDPGYRSKARAYESEVDKYYQDVEKERSRASARAEERSAQEQSIADQARAFALDWHGRTYADVLKSLEAAKANQAETAKRYEALMGQTGGEPPTREQLEAAGLGSLYTDVSATADSAAQQREAIMAKYPDIADIPVAEIGVSSKGREKNFFVYQGVKFQLDDAVKGNIGHKNMKKLGLDTKEKRQAFREELMRVGKQVEARQRELEALYSAGTARTGRPSAETRRGVPAEPGAYAAYDPLYYAEALNAAAAPLPDPRNYVEYSPGVVPTAENVATERQRATLARIDELIGQAQTLAAAGMPYEAAQITAAADQLIADQQAAVAKRQAAVDQAAADWTKNVKRARKKYESSGDDVLQTLGLGYMG